MSETKERCIELLTNNSINLDSEIDFNVNSEIYVLSFAFIVESFMQASEESQLAFLAALEKALLSKEDGAEKFFESMGQLLLMTHLSKEIIV
ncbi:hypothetical protein Suden_0221 [Sulfurimonas denitrificans DSM 1251]|uniref:Uncharacterized protein n=1 Tax=Sulfurimonas denitrificans (strain ATCC 33889 / DSM 1251) TaxID=326298 RepID=Q30U29_SULDN|nr:hypothetical protein [Sulfurimonas denitrificans]ABB43502.1 hypothetical protein Suden_0221 [Sulfurimonas denitrificans DSM 1251]MDD3443658.1 hypothetical protein [Sulfurimonas denitrificans]